jgi:peptide/nickel transport system permease protein
MSDEPLLTARQVRRHQRGAAARRTWSEFSRHRSGLVGLAVLTGFVLLAVFAPLIADPDGLKVTEATGGVLEPPSSEFWLGTDDSSRC